MIEIGCIDIVNIKLRKKCDFLLVDIDINNYRIMTKI